MLCETRCLSVSNRRNGRTDTVLTWNLSLKVVTLDQQLYSNECMRTEKTPRQMNDFFFLKERKDLYWHLEFLHSYLNLGTFANESRLEKN